MEWLVLVALILLAVPVLLIASLVRIGDHTTKLRRIEKRLAQIDSAIDTLNGQTATIRKHLDEARLLPTVGGDVAAEDETEPEQPDVGRSSPPPYRPYPSATPVEASTPSAGAAPTEPPPPLPSETPEWLVPGPAAAPTSAAAPPQDTTAATSAPTPASASTQAAPRPSADPPPPAKPRPPSAFDKWRKQLNEQLAGEGWEAVIGGSWLNKLGSLVTVVGVVLILSWSWANLDPVGRVALALALSLTLLIFGVVLERRRRYVIVARGFIGTGWAALYVTAYAMHGIDTARIIYDPLAGFLVLLAVAVGMILHSLRYRSQTVTGIAYFVAFATLTLTPLTHYAWLASLILAASLLYVAYQFTWSGMVLMGLLVTYGTFMFRVGGLQASDPLVADWSVGQGVLILYWLMFESFDLLGIAQSGARKDITATIFPLNAAAFLGISILEWSAIGPETLYLFFAMAGGAYAVSSVLRARLLPASELPESSDVVSRTLMGSYEGAVSIAAALIAAGIWEIYSGLRVGAAWLLEAEVIFLIGLQLRRPFLRWLAGVVLALPVLKLIGVDVHEPFVLDIVGTEVSIWIPLMLLTAAVLYLNRGLVGVARDLEVVLPEQAYTYVATALVVIVLGHEMPDEYQGLALFLFALALFETGLRSRLAELPYQAYGVGMLSSVALVVFNVMGSSFGVERPWLSLIPAALLTYGAAVRLHKLRRAPATGSGALLLPEGERCGALDFSSVVGTVSMASLAWHLLPAYLVPVAWLFLAVPLFETGLFSGLERIRYQAYIVAALACGGLLASHFLGLGLYVERPWLSLIPAALLTYGAAGRLYRLGKQQVANAAGGPLPEKERIGVLDLATMAGTVAVASLAWYVLPTPLVAVAWGLLGLLLIEIGYWLPLPSLRAQGNVLALSAFARTFLANFIGSGATAGISHRVLTVVPLIGLYYYLNSKLLAEAAAGQAAAPEGVTDTDSDRTRLGPMIRSEETVLPRIYLYLPVILAVVLIYYQFGPVAAVIGWAVLALVLMVLGVRWDREDFRWQAYALGILVFARSWSTNLYVAGEVFGLPGRLATGALVAVSLYACQLVSPRRGEESSSGSPTSATDWLDEHARTFFSLLATALLTLLIYYEVSDLLLTVAWTLEGTLLLLAGFALRERALRLSGLVLLGACVLKAFLYDFRELETIYRILSFIVLGLLMLGISLVYTRYKEQIRRFL